jgi:hypothetical protein
LQPWPRVGGSVQPVFDNLAHRRGSGCIGIGERAWRIESGGGTSAFIDVNLLEAPQPTRHIRVDTA